MKPFPDILTPEMLLKAYGLGIFPMAEKRDDETIYWIDPEERGIIPLDKFHISRSLRSTLRQGSFVVSVNRNFSTIIAACAKSRAGRQETWINRRIEELCLKLHVMGFAHSIEVWYESGQLAGGLYGIALGGAFFGESMVSFQRDASKIALVELVARLRAGGYTLLDTQFNTKHLARFGAIDIGRGKYRELLKDALRVAADFPEGPRPYWPRLLESQSSRKYEPGAKH